MMAIDDDLTWPGRILSGLRARRDVAAAAAALSAQWLLRRIVPAMPFAPYSVANRIVRITPGGIATSASPSDGVHPPYSVPWP
jgi:hypothetical protein